MTTFATVVAILASLGCTVTAVACVVLVLVKKALPPGMPVAMAGFALYAAMSSAALGYWWWAAGEALLVVLGVAILVLAVQLQKLRDQIKKAKEACDGNR